MGDILRSSKNHGKKKMKAILTLTLLANVANFNGFPFGQFVPSGQEEAASVSGELQGSVVVHEPTTLALPEEDITAVTRSSEDRAVLLRRQACLRDIILQHLLVFPEPLLKVGTEVAVP